MIKVVFALVSLATALAGWESAKAEDWPPASDYLFIAKDCATHENPERCGQIKKTWQRDYDGAIKGDYQGQRNVAYCLSTGCGWNELNKNPVLGCAWRVVIVNSGHLAANRLDADGLKLYCGSQFLDDTGRVMANAQAMTIMKKLGVQLPPNR